MKHVEMLNRYFDPLSVRASIIHENWSQTPSRSFAHLVRRIQNGFARILDDESQHAPFLISEALYERDENGEEYEVGLLPKRTGGVKRVLTPTEAIEGRKSYDTNKWRFHYGDDLLPHLAGQTEVLRAHRDFLSACRIMNNRGAYLATQLARAFDQCGYPGNLEAKFAKGKAFTRVLRYEQPQGNAPDAGLHRDRSALTFHWYSSHSGLVLFNQAGNPMQGNETDPRAVMTFPGTKFWAMTRGRYGKGTIHGVRDNRRDLQAATTNQARYAIVTFVHSMLDPDDVLFMREHLPELRIDQGAYRI